MSEGARLGAGGYLRLALRDLSRNRRRTGLTLVTLAVAYGALTFLGALNQGWVDALRTSFILGSTGHLQVHAAGFEVSQNLAEHMPNPEEVLAASRADPGVVAATTRARVSGLAAAAAGSAGVQILAVDPRREPEVTRLHACLSAGRWLDPAVPGEVIVGHTLAENLAMGLGERVVLTAQRPGGEMASEVFRLGGVLCPSDPERDRTTAIVGLPCAQPWLGLGTGVTDVVLRAASHDEAPAVRERLRKRLPADRYEVLAWDDLDPMIRQWLRFSQAYGAVVLLVVTALAVGQVLNTLLMVLHERTPELGLLAALGLRPRQLAGLVLTEGLLLVTVGGLIGFAVGAAVVRALAGGIDLSRFAAALGFFHMNPVIHPVLDGSTVAGVLGTVMVAALLAGGYPAAKASRIEPMRALRRL